MLAKRGRKEERRRKKKEEKKEDGGSAVLATNLLQTQPAEPNQKKKSFLSFRSRRRISPPCDSRIGWLVMLSYESELAALCAGVNCSGAAVCATALSRRKSTLE